MKLADLEQNGGIVSGDLVPKKGIWKRFDEETQEVQDYEVDFFVKRCSWLEMQDAIKTVDGEQANPELLTIAASIRLGENGEEQMSYELAAKLDSGLVNVFRIGIAEVYSKKN